MKDKKANPEHSQQTNSKELEKQREHIIVEIVEYVPNAVMSRTIIKKSTGTVTAMSISEGEEISEKKIPFENYVQVIDGEADIKIDSKDYHLKVGSGIIIPAHTTQRFYARQNFKIISTIIKSGYED
ncbi:MAG: cupin domain-containing protein [Bacteroidetes bacterium]|nr:cupin domain-containing protein [Bacteroidota bacterium]